MRAEDADTLAAQFKAMSVKQDLLEEQNERLLQRTKELEAIIEAGVPPVPHLPSSGRGGEASRGSFLQQKKQTGRRLARGALPRLEEAPVEHGAAVQESAGRRPSTLEGR
jgi:hypothetical protein